MGERGKYKGVTIIPSVMGFCQLTTCPFTHFLNALLPTCCHKRNSDFPRLIPLYMPIRFDICEDTPDFLLKSPTLDCIPIQLKKQCRPKRFVLLLNMEI